MSLVVRHCAPRALDLELDRLSLTDSPLAHLQQRRALAYALSGRSMSVAG